MPLYDIINWQTKGGSAIRFQIVGTFDGSAPKGKQLKIDEKSIQWAGGHVQVSFSFSLVLITLFTYYCTALKK